MVHAARNGLKTVPYRSPSYFLLPATPAEWLCTGIPWVTGTSREATTTARGKSGSSGSAAAVAAATPSADGAGTAGTGLRAAPAGTRAGCTARAWRLDLRLIDEDPLVVVAAPVVETNGFVLALARDADDAADGIRTGRSDR